MSEVNLTKCDGPSCENQADHNEYGAPTYHRLYWGGSEFEMSFGGNRQFDFCCVECLENWLEELKESTNV